MFIYEYVRVVEMWEELQIEMDKLLEVRCEER